MGIVDDWQSRGTHHTLLGHRIFVADIAARDERAAPVLVLHGFPTSGVDWHRTVGAISSHGRRVIVPDLLGDEHQGPFEIELIARSHQTVAAA